MYLFRIKRWIGRFGNNLLHLGHLAYLGENFDSDCIFPQHPLLTATDFGTNRGWETECVVENFEPIARLGEYGVDLARKRPYYLRKYVLGIIRRKEVECDFDIAVVIRGSEIMQKNNNRYVQAPLAYFLKIFEIEKPNKILIISEDQSNPVIGGLMGAGISGIEFRICDPITAVNIILASRVVVCGGFSTFAPTLIQCSDTVRRAYYPCFGLKKPEMGIIGWDGGALRGEHIGYGIFGEIGIQVVMMRLDGYTRYGEWEATPEQKRLMIEYPMSGVHVWDSGIT